MTFFGFPSGAQLVAIRGITAPPRFGPKAPRIGSHDSRARKGTVPAVANGGFGDTRPGPCLS
jgi:hypothetical protein